MSEAKHSDVGGIGLKENGVNLNAIAQIPSKRSWDITIGDILSNDNARPHIVSRPTCSNALGNVRAYPI